MEVEDGSEKGGHEEESIEACKLVNMGEREGKEWEDVGKRKGDAIFWYY